MASTSASSITQTSFDAVISGLLNPVSTYSLFEVELWNSSGTTFYYTNSWTDSGSGTSTSISFSGLSSGTTYLIKGFAKSGGNRNSVGSTTVTTLTPPLPGGVGAVSLSPSGTSIGISWSNATNVERYAVEVRQNGTLVYSDYNVVATSTTASGLTTCTSYDVKVYAINSQGSGSPSFNSTTTLCPPSAPTNFRVTSQTSTSVNLAWDDVSGETGYSVEVYIQGTGTIVASDYSISANTLTKFFSSLTTGTSYTFKLWAKNAIGNSTAVFTSTTLGVARPSNWTWTTLNATALAYKSGTKTRVNLVTASEWNDFTARINAFRAYKSLSPYSFTVANANTDFTNVIYQQAVTAIGAMATVNQSGGCNTKLVNLKTALNSIS